MVWPGLVKGGSSVLTITAAAFFSCGFTVGGTVTPRRESMLLRLCTVKGVWLV